MKQANPKEKNITLRKIIFYFIVTIGVIMTVILVAAIILIILFILSFRESDKQYKIDQKAQLQKYNAALERCNGSKPIVVIYEKSEGFGGWAGYEGYRIVYPSDQYYSNSIVAVEKELSLDSISKVHDYYCDKSELLDNTTNLKDSNGKFLYELIK